MSIFSLSKEAARIDARTQALVDESDPRTSIEELERWFEDHGIPSACVAAIADPSLEQMRQELIAKITSNAGLTARFFEGLAATLGYEAKVTLFRAHDVNADVNALLTDNRWEGVFILGITINGFSGIEHFTTTWDVNQPLARWGSSLLECIVRAMAPAHVDVIFLYKE